MSFGGDQTGAGGVAPLPDGAATATKQDAQTAAIEAITTTLDHPAQAGEAAAATAEAIRDRLPAANNSRVDASFIVVEVG